MSITTTGGTTSITGRESIALYRLFALRQACRFQQQTGTRMPGLRRSAFAIAKGEFGLKGSPAKILEQLDVIVARAEQDHLAGEIERGLTEELTIETWRRCLLEEASMGMNELLSGLLDGLRGYWPNMDSEALIDGLTQAVRLDVRQLLAVAELMDEVLRG